MAVFHHPNGLGKCLGESQEVRDDFVLMLVSPFEEIQSQCDNRILCTFIQAEHAHTVLLGTVAEQFVDLEGDLEIGIGQGLCKNDLNARNKHVHSPMASVGSVTGLGQDSALCFQSRTCGVSAYFVFFCRTPTFIDIFQIH